MAESRVRTERSEVTLTDFEREIIRLQGEVESYNLLVHGDSNVGKTALSGTCPGKTFWLFCEPGYKTAARMGARGVGHKVADTATALAAIDWLNHRNRYKQFDWIILDGLSTIEKRFRLDYTAEAFDANPAKRQHRNIPDRPDYFNTQNFLLSWIPQLVDLPVNFLITAHTYRTEQEDGDLMGYPGIQGKGGETANAISGLMDVTGYYEARRIISKRTGQDKLVRRLWFESPPRRSKGEDQIRYICGDKFNALGPYMDFPTIPKLLAKIEGQDT